MRRGVARVDYCGRQEEKHAKLYRITLKMKISGRLLMWYFYFFINVVARLRISLLKNVTC